MEELIISLNYRGKKIGEKLIKKDITYAKENNCDVIELTSNFSRKKAHIFITKNGFKKSSYKFKMKL